MPTKQSVFYGWTILAVAWFAYGLSLCPAYYSWSVVSPRIVVDLELSREQVGRILGLFVFLLGGSAPLVGAAIDRYGARLAIAIGCIVSGIGFLLMSRAESYLDCILSFSILGGVGVAFASQVPTQTLAANWFVRYRALAMGIILSAGGIVGKCVPYVNQYLIEWDGWRLVWVVVACVSAIVAIVSFLLVKNRPSDLGQYPDGVRIDDATTVKFQTSEDLAALTGEKTPSPNMTWRDALRTPQFYILCMCSTASTMPYNVIASQGPLHFADIGFGPVLVGGLIGTMALFSVFGRLVGSLGDLVAPIVLLAMALIVMGVSMTIVLATDNERVVKYAIMIFAVGHGVAYTSRYATVPKFFGVGSFPTLVGTMGFVDGAGSFLATTLTGRTFDQTGSYQPAFTIVSVFVITVGLVACFTRPPRNTIKTLPDV